MIRRVFSIAMMRKVFSIALMRRAFSIAMMRRLFSIDMVDSHLQNKLKVVISMGWSLVRINSCDPVSLHSEMCRDLYTNC